MIWLYRILFLPAVLVALPYYALRMWRRGGYRRDFGHRFGRMPGVPARRPGVRRIWIQAVSVGELLAIGPLLARLAEDASIEVCLTTTTSTGRRVAEEQYLHQTCWRGIFPLDWRPFSSAAWRTLQPDLAVLMENELWPEHLQQAKQRKVPVILLNARLSDRSFRRYRRIGAVARPLLRPLTEIIAGTRQDAGRFATLGIPGVEPRTGGNMKFDVKLKPIPESSLRDALRAETGFQPDDLVLLGSSTWPGEEAMLAAAAERARLRGHTVRTLIVPRHAERRAEIASSLGERWGVVHFRTSARQAPPGTAIYVADTTGELQAFTQLADIVFVGKTMPPHTEGQTPIEAAGHGKPVLLGPGTSNFRLIAESLLAAGGARRVPTAGAFAEALEQLLADPAERAAMGQRARIWLRQHTGATATALTVLHRHLPTAAQ